MENPLISLEGIRRFLENLSVNAIMKEDGKGLSSNDLTHLLKAQYDQAYAHALSPHAPISAQENLIERIQVNGSLLTIANKTVDVPVPTKLSQLANDLGYLVGHPTTNTSPDITSEVSLNYGQTFTAVKNVLRDSNGHVRRIDTETLILPQEYTHPDSPVSPGSFKNVTINRYGHVISGSNPTTRDGFGLTDVMTRTEVQQSIKEAVSASEGLTRTIVTALPSVIDGDPNKIYLVLRSTTSIGGAVNNIYEEFMLINGKWEKIGDTSVDLDGYLHIDRYPEITKLDIDSMFFTLPEAGRQILNIVGTGYLVQQLKGMIDSKASADHDHGGLVTQAEAIAGTSEEIRLWSPERVARAIRGVPLTGLGVIGNSISPINSSDSFLKGMERLQGQINSLRAGSEIFDTNFDFHLQNKFNPHEVTINQIGAAAVNHTHDSADLINSLSLAQLPTSNQANMVLRVGAANSNPSYGKLQLATDVSGVLPIVNGGTGANDAAGARANLGITLANLGAAASIHKHEVTDLIINQRLGNESLPTSSEGDRVLAVLFPNTSPEYTQINSKMLLDDIIKNQHLVDRTITSVKLQESLSLSGTPTAETPVLTDKSKRLATTEFVQGYVGNFCLNFVKPGADGKLALSLIPEHSHPHTHPISDISGVVPVNQIPNLDASKITSGRFGFERLPTSANGNRVLKVWNAYTDPDWGQVNLETDVIGVLPANNIGNIDANKVTSGIFNVARIPDLSATKITSDRLSLNRLPTSATANRVLKVATANGDPIWSQISNLDIAANAGIEKSKLEASVQTSLGKADTALQSLSGGLRGQLYFVKTDNAVSLEAGWSLIQGKAVGSDEELNYEKSKTVSFSEIFDTWERFSVPDSTEKDSWIYDSTNDRIICTINSSNFIGFASPQKYDSYVHEATLSSTDADDDPAGILIAYHKDSGGNIHTLTALRIPNTSQNSIWGVATGISDVAVNVRWIISYNYNGVNKKIIANGDSSIVGGIGGWSLFPTGVRIRIERKGDIITAITSQMNSLTLDQNTKLTVNLNSDPLLSVFKGGSSYGYACISQNQTTYSNIVFSDVSSVILDLRTNKVYSYQGGVWVLDASSSVESLAGRGRIIYNSDLRKLFFFRGPNDFISVDVGPEGLEVIGQAAAEAGTGITATGWSSLRVRQAANAAINARIHAGRNNEANKLVRTDASGYLQTGYINSSTGVENPVIANIITDNGDGYYRKASLAHLKTSLAVANSSHNHDASNINAGILPLARGGTGNATGDAASVGGVALSALLRTAATNQATARQLFTYNNGAITSTAGSISALEIGAASTNALMTFHRSGFACHFGLSTGLNELAVGGWSMGAVQYPIVHTGNLAAKLAALPNI